MPNIPHFARPTFDAALKEWKNILAARRLPADLVWIFDENLCFEKDASAKDGFKLGFQTQFAPPPAAAEQIAFEHFMEFRARMVFYRLGTARGKSVCLLLCDEWFEGRNESTGFIRRDDWLISFRPGGAEEVEEIADEPRWQKRVLRDRPLHDLDFSMTLQAVHETLAHGRVLSSYEHYALKFLHAWRRLLGEKK
jgi:hypothetical protein